MLEKPTRSFTEHVEPLMSAGVHFDAADALAAFEHVSTALIIHIKGDPWKMTEKAIDSLRQKGYPNLLSHR